MAINFPNSPSLNETYSENDTSWKWDGTSWNRLTGLVGTESSTLSGVGATQFARRDVNNVITGITTLSTSGVGNTTLNVEGDSRFGSNVSVVGVSTFTGNIDANGNLDVDGTTELDVLNVSDTATFSGAIDANGALDVDGQTDLDVLNVSDTATFSSNIVGAGATVYNSGLIVGKQGAEFQGIVTASKFIGDLVGSITSGSNIDLGDSTTTTNRIRLGVSTDMSIFHNGLDSHIDNETGNLILRTNVSSDVGGNIKLMPKGSENGIIVTHDASVELYHGMGSGASEQKKFETTTTGAKVIGDLEVSGALTYEDITNVDAVGIITARAGIVDSTLTAGRVTYAGTNGRLTDSANLTFDGAELDVNNSGGSARLYLVSGNSADSSIYFGRQDDGATGGIRYEHTDNSLRFMGYNNSERLRITSAGKVGINSTSPTYALEVDGGTQNTVIAVRSSDAKAAISFLDNTSGGYGRATIGGEGDSVYITSGAGYERIRFGTGGNNTSIGINTTNNMVTNSEILTVRGVSSFKSHTQARPALYLGNEGSVTDTANQLILFNQGGANRGGIGYVPNTGELRFNNQYFITFTTGASTLGGTERLRITAAGATEVKGDLYVKNTYPRIYLLDTDSNSDFSLINDNGTFSIYDDSNSAHRLRITAAGTVEVYPNNSSAGVINLKRGTSTDQEATFYYGSSYLDIETREVTGIRLKTNKQDRLIIDSDGHVTPGAANTYDLGSTSKEFRNLYLGDGGSVYFGNDQDVRMFYDPAGSSSFTIDANAGYTYINSDAIRLNSKTSGWNYLRADKSDGVLKLYKSNSVKLTTSDTGISVTGEVAASQDYPDFRPVLDFNFIAVKKLDSRITFTRNTPASYVNEFGIVKLVGDNTPRFDHDVDTRECKGLLIEEGRTTRLTQSTGNDSYSHYKQTDQGETIKGPDGVDNSAREYTVNSDGGTNGSTTIWANEAIGIANATSFSFFVKITRGSTMAFRLFDNNNNLESHKWTISGGYITDGSYATVVQSDPGSTEGTSSYERYPNGWVKCKWENLSKSGGNATSYIQLYIWDHANSNGTNIGYGIWGFQVENGNVCTSTIPKPTTAAVTRGADVVSIEGEEFTDFYNQEEGTLVLSASYTEDIRTSAAITIDDTSNESEYTEVGYRAGGGSSGTVGAYTRTDAGNDQYYKGWTSSATQYNEFKVAFAYKDNDYASSANGQTVDTDTSGTTSKVFDRLRFSDVDTVGSIGSGYYRRLMYYAKRLPNNQVVTLTS